MDAARFRELEHWFTRAMETPPEQHGALVAEATTSDPDLGRELARMLAVVSPDSMFGRLVSRAGAQLLAVGAEGERAGNAPPRTHPVSSSPASELIGRLASRATSAARYAIAGEVARGGMSVILRAYDPDLRRPLAMKVALDAEAAADTRRQPRIARFLAEAQVTGQLDHPGIVPVHEIGLDADARPYFTMRLVGGRNLDAIYALARQGAEGWSTMRVLGVLLKVCEAVAYAHSKGVLHRDLKPANVMVGRFGEVYVMDWGLAKVLDQGDSTESADGSAPTTGAGGGPQNIRDDEGATDPGTLLRTVEGTVMGTPAYMSPEQAAGDVTAIDVRADVYALGTMLYQFFAGHAPYHDDGRALDVRQLWEQVLSAPPTPLGRCAPSTPPELLAIVELAMARDRAVRYPSVAALAEDLRAYTEGRVVTAYETGAWAELRKWIGRNQALASALATVVLAVAIGAIGFAIKADQAATAATAAGAARFDAEQAAATAKRSEATARAREAEARTSERRAATIMKLVQSALVGANPHTGGDRDLRVADAMSPMIVDLDAGMLGDDPETESGLQVLIAEVLYSNGRCEDALTLAQRALDTRRGLFQGDAEQVAESLDLVARCLMRFARMKQALPMFEEALAMRQRLSSGDDEQVAQAMGRLADCYYQLGQGQQGLPWAQEALRMHRSLHPLVAHMDVATSLSDVGHCLADIGDFDKALAFYEEALAMDLELCHGDHIRVAHDLMNAALANKHVRRRPQALEQYEAALAMLTNLLGEHDEVVECLNAMGGCCSRAEALPVYQRALDMANRLHPGNNRAKASSLSLVGLCLIELGKFEEALPHLQAALAMRQAMYPEDHYVVARSLSNVGQCLIFLGRPDQALPMFEQCWTMQQYVRSPGHPDLAVAAGNLAGCLMQLGKAEEALPIYQAALELCRQQPGDSDEAQARSLSNLGDCLHALRRHEEALDHLRTALTLAQQSEDQDLDLEATIRNNLASILRALHRPEAQAMFEAALDIRERLWADHPNHPDVAQALNNLANCLCEFGEHEQALGPFRRALAIREVAFGAVHPLVGGSLHNLASCLQLMRRSAEALPLAERAQAIAAAQHVAPPWSKSCTALLRMIKSSLGK